MPAEIEFNIYIEIKDVRFFVVSRTGSLDEIRTGQFAFSMHIPIDTHVLYNKVFRLDRRLESLCTTPGHIPVQYKE